MVRNLLSAGPTEDSQGPDDLYAVSPAGIMEETHGFTWESNRANSQTREAHIHVPAGEQNHQPLYQYAIVGYDVIKLEHKDSGLGSEYKTDVHRNLVSMIIICHQWTGLSVGRVSESQSSQVKSSSSVTQIIVDEIDSEGKYIRLRNLSSEVMLVLVCG
ncbi:butyrophilin subfamily 3 member A3-like isoform X1 [Lates japonicus]|uniref:Butyrophilin subfamily 3 member A3-like isoform X1 n=1 Tax=Lates japonicus TaxID=270547 RepID=A0AAD3RHD9_LATJO|nr:butyrophilin subfamily 3 member A3-like isoform X1 [Lates japonicus]